MQIVGQINRDEHTGRGGVDTHVVCGVVQELRSAIPLDVMAVEISPSKLDVEPELLCGSTIHCIPTNIIIKLILQFETLFYQHFDKLVCIRHNLHVQ